jgi:hypothetical protein
MPEGLLSNLSPGEAANLVAYLESLEGEVMRPVACASPAQKKTPRFPTGRLLVVVCELAAAARLLRREGVGTG